MTSFLYRFFLGLPLASVRVRRYDMKNRDELAGRTEQVKGRMKQKLGEMTDDERLHDEGVADEAAGDVQEGFGRARRKVGEAIKDVGDTIKR
jgi:uncharacterized protein YjbJ (UPF0337 family)